ncbi:hypothetical protein RCG19_15940 [Neobacillus sp. OS1-2]|uniref:hypothetical protein n=1 Tax=Neobacillus sp. OS1-2 TaxID=3070680 RepID=UPI0027DF62A4|nr:hypothetical protein [Neobacillus sp. OS1-2]WML38679.1 hypothetical protein RCG19_15940 [Neobacillus sp. OS1-2]
MIKDALQYLINLGNVETKEIGTQTFSTQKLHLVPADRPNALSVRSLTGLIDYLISGFDADPLGEAKMVHVVSPTEVIAFSSFNRDYERNDYIKASAMLPSFSFDRWYDSEEFNIKLQSAFVANEDRNIMLQVVGNIREENVRTVGDDGVSQAVQAKVGIATVGTVQVPNPVILAPFRTFVEVGQPESEFIFRMKNGPSCALFEADGGAWKLAAMKNIKEFLQGALESEIEAGKIVIIA